MYRKVGYMTLWYLLSPSLRYLALQLSTLWNLVPTLRYLAIFYLPCGTLCLPCGTLCLPCGTLWYLVVPCRTLRYLVRPLRCSVDVGMEYSPDRSLTGVKILEIVGKFKRVSINYMYMPDLVTINLIGSCSAEKVKAPEGVDILCQTSEGQVS